ncbi:MAG TPA: hypothetical protein VMU75_05585 [Acidimicrobiales bacterium]|nr:hypothetical protein [Acidimicrobiales bacterium]
MAGERPLFEELLDLALYAPLGVALRVLEELPGLTEKGRARIGGQVGAARTLGRFAVTTLRRQAESVLERTGGRPAAAHRGADAEHVAPEHAEPARSRRPQSGTATRARPRRSEGQGPGAHGVTGGAPAAADELAIPGYDALAASQVVPRLEGLSREELDAVRRHEEATRRRRTILGRISQLEEELDGHAR